MSACGCVQTVASHVFCTEFEVEVFGDLGRLLRELGEFERIRALSVGSDGAFVARWTCPSLVDVTRRISNLETITANARLAMAINSLSRLRMEDDREETHNGDDDENALKLKYARARIVDNYSRLQVICLDGGGCDERAGQGCPSAQSQGRHFYSRYRPGC